MNILIVEDNPISAKIVDLNLVKHGYRTLLAKDGEEAWGILNENSDIQLLIADINLPRLTGLELIQRMQGHSWLGDIPVIVVSSVNQAEVVTQAADLGVKKYVVKPIKTAQLLGDIRSILGHNYAILASQREIQMRMEIDRECYQEMIQSFSALVRETLDMLLRIPNMEERRLAVEDLAQLSESAELLGAERLHRYVEKLTRKDKINTYHYYFLLHEIRALEALLPAPPGGARPVASDSDTAIRNQRIREQMVHPQESVFDTLGDLE